MSETMVIRDLGVLEFAVAYALQEELVDAVAQGKAAETLLLLEHPPVYTAGSGANLANVLDPSIQAVRTNRGGDVTWHGPGQLVGYPILDLRRRGRDLHRYLRALEELLIRVAVGFRVDAHRLAGRTGVWTAAGKLASIGVGLRRWVSMHGFSLNVSPDLDQFRRINPCGLAGCPVTSLSQLLGTEVPMAEVKSMLEVQAGQLLSALPVVRGGGL